MTTQVEICNLALSLLGRPSINLLDENTAEARACRRLYRQARRACLATSSWTFARTRVSAAPLTVPPDTQWRYAYQRPTDAIAIVRLLLDGDPPHMGIAFRQFAVLGDTIRTNLPPPVLIDYVSDLTDESRFPPLFTEYMAMHLAAMLSMDLVKRPETLRELRQQELRARSEAITADAAQDVQFYAFDEDHQQPGYSLSRKL
jgi:hypothetical protein